MKFVYKIKKDSSWLFPYTTVVSLKDFPFDFELKISQTLLGAKRKINTLKRELIRKIKEPNIVELEDLNIIESGDLKE